MTFTSLTKTNRPSTTLGDYNNSLFAMCFQKLLSRSPCKEVIQPHLPVRLPCYDFTPVISPAFGVPLPKVGVTTSGVANFHGVTGGVYKARERIHRSMLTCDY